MGRVLSSRYVITDAALYNRSRPAAPAVVVVPQREPAKAQPINGAPLWAELHRWALGGPAWAPGASWLAGFRRRVPCGECRKHWDEMSARTPPDWADLFGWTVARHNEVNVRLAKPIMDAAAARQIWASAGSLL